MTTITLPRAVVEQALEALKFCTPKPRPADDDYAENGWKEHNAAITALRAALAQQAEPQTLDEAMQHPRAMAQAYAAGYNAGVAHEREACAKLCEQMPELEHGWKVTLPSDCAAAIRARGGQS